MPSLGFPELIVIFVVALLVFGPRKLPELGRSLGKSLSEFKRASTELRSTLDEEIRLEERKAPVPAPASAAPPPEASHAASEPGPEAGPSELGQPETVARGSQPT